MTPTPASLIQDFVNDVRILGDVTHSIGCHATDGPLDNDDCLVAWALLEEARGQLAVASSQIAHRLAELMDEKRRTVEDFGTFERHRKTDRKRWDTDELRRVVLDTKLVNTETGEVIDETPLDKILTVWNLGPPRVTALRERGIDPDEFCEVERGGWAIQVIR